MGELQEPGTGVAPFFRPVSQDYFECQEDPKNKGLSLFVARVTAKTLPSNEVSGFVRTIIHPGGYNYANFNHGDQRSP